MEPVEREHNFALDPVGIQNILNPAGEDAVLEDISLEVLVEDIFSSCIPAANAAIEPAEVE